MSPSEPSGPSRTGRRAHARRSTRRHKGLWATVVVLLAGAAAAGVGLRFAGTNAKETPKAGRSAKAPSRAVGAVEQGAPRPVDSRLFTPGSCIAYPPVGGGNGKVVFLDAGHGGPDPGATGTTLSGRTIYEADETLPVELDTMALLRRAGFEVVVSRTRASAVIRPRPGDMNGTIFTVRGEEREIAARDRCANMAKADVLVGIYFDAGASPSDAGSISTYDRVRPFWRESKRLATLVQRNVLAALNKRGWGIPNDGVSTDSSLGGPPLSAKAAVYGHLLLLGPAMAGYFTTPSQMPGTIVEPLFITDPFEGSKAASGLGQHVIASGIAKAVEQYFAPARKS